MKYYIDIENKQAVIDWLEQVKRGSGDARMLWRAVLPKVQKEFIEGAQFSSHSNVGKGWKSLTPKYKRWKSKNGFQTVIGVMTGKLRKAAGTGSIVKMLPKSMTIRVDESKAVRKGVAYAKYFNDLRPVYKAVPFRINSFLATDVKKFNTGSHNSFSYAWLRNSLRPQ